MQLYSTKSPNSFVTLKDAVLKGLPSDNGLFMPANIPVLSSGFFSSLKSKSLQEIAFEVSKALIEDEIPDKELRKIIDIAVNFPAPLVSLDKHTHVLELFHGPTLAFKDFGARFMAQLLSYFTKESNKELVILVATSGDTGGAVASGFYKTPGIRVVILYPSGSVSQLQEKQLTTLGHNIAALEVDGTFDDCQAMVKKAFLDVEINEQICLSSANSINIARLIPQSFYYFEAFKQLDDIEIPVVFSVPSGNFGNLTAGLLAKRMGLPIHKFIAATNTNDVFPQFLKTGRYIPLPSVRTMSNAMDVGDPSNFYRIADLFGLQNTPPQSDRSTWNNLLNHICGYSFTDEATAEGLKEVYNKYKYIIDPHGSIGYLAFRAYQNNHPNIQGIILETAHPSKFIDDVEKIIDEKVIVPHRLSVLAREKKIATCISKKYVDLKGFLLKNYR